MRIGQGFDVHQFAPNRELVIGGVKIPYHLGLLAHSDGDVVIHAIIDALLGAMAWGDIGQRFPDASPLYHNIDSRILLMDVYQEILAKKYLLNNLDVTIFAQHPRMSIYISKMCQNLTVDFQCIKNQINIKATTTEGLGFIGRGEGIACQAIVLLIDR